MGDEMCRYCHGVRLVGWSGAGPILCPECSRDQDAFTVITQAWREQRGKARELTAAIDEARAQLAKERDEHEQCRVQLAGCGAGALGYADDCKPGDYGWSASLGDVLQLRKRWNEDRDQLTAQRNRNDALQELLDVGAKTMELTARQLADEKEHHGRTHEALRQSREAEAHWHAEANKHYHHAFEAGKASVQAQLAAAQVENGRLREALEDVVRFAADPFYSDAEYRAKASFVSVRALADAGKGEG